MTPLCCSVSRKTAFALSVCGFTVIRESCRDRLESRGWGTAYCVTKRKLQRDWRQLQMKGGSDPTAALSSAFSFYLACEVAQSCDWAFMASRVPGSASVLR